jgi:hypothetical protein
MNTNRALEIISLLSDGIDPYTGEVFSEGAYQHPDTVRALYKAKEALIRVLQYEKKQKYLPVNAGMVWSEEEENQLVAAFEEGTEIKVLAGIHKRTEGAVRTRLARLGKFELE